MADNVAITAGTGTSVATDDVAGVHYQKVKIAVGAADVANLLAVGSGVIDTGTPRVTLASNSPGVTTLGQATMVASLPVAIASDQTAIPMVPAGGTTITPADIVRPADVLSYAANEAWSDSTTAPTAGGYTLTGMGRVSGGSGIITDAIITTSNDPATLLQGEIWLFDTAVTAINDNTAFAVSDAEIKTFVGKIPFAMEDAGNNGSAHMTGLNLAYTCVGSANLRFLIKVKNAYAPANAEALTVRLKVIYTS